MTLTVQQPGATGGTVTPPTPPYLPPNPVPSAAPRPNGIDGCLQTFNESQLENVVRSQSDNNAMVKVRRRTTAAVRVADATVTVPSAEVELWKKWFDVACQGGVLPTYFRTPYGIEEAWRFSAPLSITWGQGSGVGKHFATISMKLEQMPAWRPNA
jgi:hypothetical protein